MNIQEAIKSGKRYRRKGEKSWYDTAPDFTHYAFSTQDVLSDDWEVEPATVTITLEQFNATVTTVADKLYRPTGWPIHINDFLGELKKELGL